MLTVEELTLHQCDVHVGGGGDHHTARLGGVVGECSQLRMLFTVTKQPEQV